MIGYLPAIKEMYALFYAGWVADSAAIVDYIPEIRGFGIEKTTAPPTEKYWCRWSQTSVNEEQDAIVSEDGITPYKATGRLFIQIFGPRSDDSSSQNCMELADMTKKIYRGITTDSGIKFDNVRTGGLQIEDKWNMITTDCKYQYREPGA